MPHDKNGQEIWTGDRVTMEFEVVSVVATEDYCNVNLRSVEGMPPLGKKTELGAVNTRQVVKVAK